MATPINSGKQNVKAIWFDFMGTCLDWHSTITDVLPKELAQETRSKFALEWRQNYFEANDARLRRGEPPEDIDITHRMVLDNMLSKQPKIAQVFTNEIREEAIKAWHRQKAWSDVSEALQTLKQKHGLEIYVHANGTTRLQLDLIQSSGLKFDMLFSSELIGHIKPGPEMYEKALKLLRLKPEECIMVAAHAYDLRGAKNVGLKTVYIYRWTDDIREDQEKLKQEFDEYLDGMKDLGVTISKYL